MGGYLGRILRFNLNEKSYKVEELDIQAAKRFIGGRGIGTYYYKKEVSPEIDALSEENKLIIATGPLTGTPCPTSARYMVVTKSPLTGTIASSNSGGYWGPELKFAGYDMIILEGKLSTPGYIYINDDTIEIRDASHLWGKIVKETTKTLLDEVEDKKSRVLTIGPAGEKLSLLASIMNDVDRAAGRSGVGAVMGSKNLKAIVVKGSNKVPVHDADGLKEAFKGYLKKIKENGVTGQGLPTYGTGVLVNIINEHGVMPADNFQKSYTEDVEPVSGETLTEKHLIRKDPCYKCPIACGRYSKTSDGSVETGGPEYETMWGFSTDCGLTDMDAIIKANYWCNQMGMDTISVAATISCAMEMYQKGYIKDEELEGIPLQFGNADGMVEWTRKLGLREGFGDKLALGSYRLADMYGVKELSMSVKKQEIPAYDPRGIQGQGLQYATSNRGGCHVRGYLISPEILGLPEKLDRLTLQGKPEWVKIFQDLTASIDATGLCLFTSFALNADDYAQMMSLVTGFEYDANEILRCGDRIYNMEKMYNLDAGIASNEDTLPSRLLNDPIPQGPSKGFVHKLDELLPKYYEARGWKEDGTPSEEKLKDLGLDK